MGRHKALLPFDDRPLIAHIVSRLLGLFPRTVVVAAPAQELPELPVPVVRDDVPFQGPVGGILYGVRAAGAELSFVTSCDSAFLDTRVIEFLLEQTTDRDVVVPQWQGRLQPLHAIYRASVLPLLEAQLARGDLRPVHLYDSVRTRVVSEEEVRRLDPEGASFFNMNTPEDYADALVRWRRLHAAGIERELR